MEIVNLFCLPFAGGSKYSYRDYEKYSPPFLKIIPLEYPGRGNRMREPLMTNADSLVTDLYRQIKNKIGQSDYAFYGHSMGGLLIWLLTRRLMEENEKLPLHLFITGTPGPSAFSRKNIKRHLLEKGEFIEEVKRIGGSVDEVLTNKELFNYYEPILRADFTATETYIYKECSPLDMPFTVITGSEEDMEPDEIHSWQKETNNATDFKRMPGNHFFIFKHSYEIMEIISKKLIDYTKSYQK